MTKKYLRYLNFRFKIMEHVYFNKVLSPLVDMKKNVSTLHVRTAFKKNGIRDLLSVFFWASVFLFAPVSHAQNTQDTWQIYMEYLKNDMSKDAMGDLSQLKLLKYTYKGEIKSEKDKSRVIEAIFSDKAPYVSELSKLVISDTTYTDTDITIHQKIYPNFEIATIRQMMDTGKLTKDSIAVIKQRFYQDIRVGDGYLDLDWSYKGKKFRSLSIIPKDGIPLDPISSRLSTGRNTIINGRNPINEKK